jgi:hypothetical protein
MKPSSIRIRRSLTAGLVVPFLLVHPLHAQPDTTPKHMEIREVVTEEQLVLKYRQESQNDPMKNMKPSKVEDPSKVNQPVSLLASSDIICFGGKAVLVPKRAILQLPDKLKERTKMVTGAQFVSWADFYAMNRGWITTVEVSRSQAEGNLEIDKETLKRISESSNMIVATYLTGPISVLPLKVPVTEPAVETKTLKSSRP